ncbi:uncharacterized protein LOC133815736 [Humulus lupulus]|uniref:uncharacterized protein LOC133815736 n=1 Tax=Humulus lupulus TaxID=3486 RepID=UPI002B40182B|nr:uncharacterized protein LOC133815736 [Humulus lupulus]
MECLRKYTLHLGLPLLHSRESTIDFKIILDEVKSKVQGWKSKLLSKVGKVTLIQTFGCSFVSYMAASGPIPSLTAKDIDKSLRGFWWGHSEAGWDLTQWLGKKVCKPKMLGGLGF